MSIFAWRGLSALVVISNYDQNTCPTTNYIVEGVPADYLPAAATGVSVPPHLFAIHDSGSANLWFAAGPVFGIGPYPALPSFLVRRRGPAALAQLF